VPNLASLSLANKQQFIQWKNMANKLEPLSLVNVVMYEYEYIRDSWPWSYSGWIYNYICNQCLSPLTLWVWILLMRGVLETILCDKVCQWLAAGWWFSPSTPPVSFTNKTGRHDITEILLKVALNTITLTHLYEYISWISNVWIFQEFIVTYIYFKNKNLTTYVSILVSKYLYEGEPNTNK
jgi:hypothetical protein